MIIEAFTLEELMLVKSCHTYDREKAIRELKSYLKDVEPALAMTIHNTVDKLEDLNPEEFLEVADYPI